MSDLIGKTIVAVEENEHGDELLLRFSDGTGARLAASGYEDADLSVTAFTADELVAHDREVARERAEAEERERVSRERAEEVRRMRESLPEAEYEAWMDENRPGWRHLKIMADTFYAPLLENMRRQSVLLNAIHKKP